MSRFCGFSQQEIPGDLWGDFDDVAEITVRNVEVVALHSNGGKRLHRSRRREKLLYIPQEWRRSSREVGETLGTGEE